MEKEKREKSLLEKIIFLLIAGAVLVGVGQATFVVSHPHFTFRTNEIMVAHDHIQNHHYFNSEEHDLVEGAIRGMLAEIGDDDSRLNRSQATR